MSTTSSGTATGMDQLRALIADDSYAMTFQTFGQYRTALLKAIDVLPASSQPAAVDESNIAWGHELQQRLMTADGQSDEELHNLLGEVACLLAVLTGCPGTSGPAIRHCRVAPSGTAKRLRDLAAGKITGEIPVFEYSLAADRIQDLEGLLEQRGAAPTVQIANDHVGDEREAFQHRVQPWMMACFGTEISADAQERNHRFFEESTELVQACGMTAAEAHMLVDYVFGRPIGEKVQEAGGVMVTLAALCLAQGIDMHDAGEVELARIWTKVESIRAKQAAKPKGSPLPIAAPVSVAVVDTLDTGSKPQSAPTWTPECAITRGDRTSAADAGDLSAEVLRALSDARALAMKNVVAARVPESGDFGNIAQNQDWALDQLTSGSATDSAPANQVASSTPSRSKGCEDA